VWTCVDHEPVAACYTGTCRCLSLFVEHLWHGHIFRTLIPSCAFLQMRRITTKSKPGQKTGDLNVVRSIIKKNWTTHDMPLLFFQKETVSTGCKFSKGSGVPLRQEAPPWQFVFQHVAHIIKFKRLPTGRPKTAKHLEVKRFQKVNLSSKILSIAC